jgi:hypothetical protein
MKDLQIILSEKNYKKHRTTTRGGAALAVEVVVASPTSPLSPQSLPCPWGLKEGPVDGLNQSPVGISCTGF